MRQADQHMQRLRGREELGFSRDWGSRCTGHLWLIRQATFGGLVFSGLRWGVGQGKMRFESEE